MDPRLQRRVQRYGWDRAVAVYEQRLAGTARPGSQSDARHGWRCGRRRACSTSPAVRAWSRFRVPQRSVTAGTVVGTDISGEMVEAAARAAAAADSGNVRFERADAEVLPFADGAFDVALCGLGLMYVPDPIAALREMRRVLRPGGRAAVAVWGARRACGWAEIFPITDARVASDVCPMFFHLGTQDTLAHAFAAAGFADVRLERIGTILHYASAEDALAAVFQGGPVALAYSRFDEPTRRAVHAEYLDSIAPYATGDGYRIPGEFVVAVARSSVLQIRHDRELEHARI